MPGEPAVSAQSKHAHGVELAMFRFEKVPVRWLWVPSMSQTVRAPQSHSASICLQRLTTVACANQGHADFGSNLALSGETGQSFVWSNRERSSAKVEPLQSGADGGGHWGLYELPLETLAPWDGCR